MRPVLAVTFLAALAAHAAETVRIAMGERPEREVVVRGKGLQLGPDSEDGPFQPLDRDEVRVRHVGDAMEVEGQRVDGAVRFRTSDISHALRAGNTEVRGEVVALPRGSKVLLVNVLPARGLRGRGPRRRDAGQLPRGGAQGAGGRRPHLRAPAED